MDFGFRRLKLGSKLSLLVAIPFFLSLSILVYFLRDSQAVTAHLKLVAVVLAFLFAYGLLAILFIRNLVKGIKSVELASAGLASGAQSNGYSSKLPETQKIIKAISKAQDDLRHQTGFAEQIKTGNLNASYELRHENDYLGRALLSIKDNLVTIKEEDQ